MRERDLLADALNRLVEAEPGFDAHDQEIETVGQASQTMTPLEQAFNRNYDIQQFVEPGAVGGGIPVFGVGAVGGGSMAPAPAPPPPPAPAPVPAPAPNP